MSGSSTTGTLWCVDDFTTTHAQAGEMRGKINEKMRANDEKRRKITFQPKLLPIECKESDNFPTLYHEWLRDGTWSRDHRDTHNNPGQLTW